MQFKLPKRKITLWHGDCKKLLKRLPDNSIDMVLTSPPYDNLRSYNNQKPFIFDDLRIIAGQLQRVLKRGGIIVWVVGDGTVKGSETGSSFRQALYFKDIGLNLFAARYEMALCRRQKSGIFRYLT